MAREYQDLAVETQSIIEDMPARHADVLREFVEAIHRRRSEGAINLWIAREADGDWWAFGNRPSNWRGRGVWMTDDENDEALWQLVDGLPIELKPGQCQRFVMYPRDTQVPENGG